MKPTTLSVIKDAKQKTNEEAVGMLRELLRRAETGEIETVFAVTFAPDGAYRTCFSASMNSLQKVGALACLQRDYIHSVERD